MKILVIGDCHAKPEELDDCTRLQGLVLKVCGEEKPDLVVYLGDQFNTHALKSVEVEKFWIGAFDALQMNPVDLYVLVGNHDRPGNAASSAHSLQTFRHLVTVVDEPVVRDNLLFLPYYHDPKQMIEAANTYPDTKLLFCHAAFAGGHYDNGVAIKADAFYGKDVASPDDLPQQTVISGHIHMPAKFGKIWYPGAPRWFSMGDANTSRAIWLIEVEDGKVVSERSFSTDSVCRRTWQLDMTPEDDCGQELAIIGERDKVLFNVRGPKAFCEESKRSLQERGYRVRVFPTDQGVAKVSESEGIEAAWGKHFQSFCPKYGTSKAVLKDLLAERLHV